MGHPKNKPTQKLKSEKGKKSFSVWITIGKKCSTSSSSEINFLQSIIAYIWLSASCKFIPIPKGNLKWNLRTHNKMLWPIFEAHWSHLLWTMHNSKTNLYLCNLQLCHWDQDFNWNSTYQLKPIAAAMFAYNMLPQPTS